MPKKTVGRRIQDLSAFGISNLKWIFARFFIIICAILLSVLMLLYAELEAAIELNVELETSTSLDSNVLRTSIEPIRDIFYTVTPTVSAQYSTHRTTLRLDSSFISDWYHHHNDANTHQLLLTGGVSYHLSSYFSLAVNNALANFQNLRLPATIADIAEPLSYISNQLSPILTYQRSNGMSLTLRYDNELRAYRDVTDFSRNTNQATFTFLYPLGHKTSAELEFGVRHNVFEANDSYLSRFVFISVSRKLSSKLDLNVQAGWADRNFINFNNNISTIPFDITITGRIFRQIPLTFSFRRALTDSDVSGAQPLIPLGNVLSLSWDVTPKIQLKVEGNISRDRYARLQRSDLRFFGKLQVGYRIRPIGTLYVMYEYQQINSQFEAVEGFRQSQVGISVVKPLSILPR